SEPSSGSWAANIAGADGGRDIGMGGPNDSTWIISNRSTGDGNFAVKRWNGGGFVEPVNPGSGVRITVDSAGHPWVVRVDHNVFVNETDDGTAQWTQIKNVTQGPEACATDIGAGRFGGLYITGCQTDGTNFDIWMLS